MAKRAAESFSLVRELAGSEEACRVLSLMEECEPYVNVLILEAIFAIFDFKSSLHYHISKLNELNAKAQVNTNTVRESETVDIK